MKAILTSIRPQHVANILNEIKTLEIRKKFPKDYVGWVYIYCTKDKKDYLCKPNEWGMPFPRTYALGGKCCRNDNGKVVARFWCDKVEEIEHRLLERHYTATLGDKELLTKSCLSHEEIHDYLRTNIGYAIHITKLEIFNRPKEISEFKKCYRSKGYPQNQSWYLTRVPQSWCWIEV